MNIHRALLGVFDGEPYLGSLDFLSGQARLAAWPSAITASRKRRGSGGQSPPAMDLVIMNPPFTRDSLRHDQFSRTDEVVDEEAGAGNTFCRICLTYTGGATLQLGKRVHGAWVTVSDAAPIPGRWPLCCH